MTKKIPGPYPDSEMKHFLDTFLYTESAFLIDEVIAMDPKEHSIEARMDTLRPLPFSQAQRVSPNHPAHVSGAEIVMTTGSLGCLHAWFFHGCRWDEGWAGFGNRIHRADFKRLAEIGPPLHLKSKEVRKRSGANRVVMRVAFDFWQENELVYTSEQSAMFFKEKILSE
ncbi:MAG: hypothetical protein CL917_06010 [Deltaproteobacteria bacterium]|nr:hypothetical protein [Deltaproteobacteria bacterium]